MDTSAILAVITVIVVFFWWLQSPRGRKQVPSITGLPFVGYIPFLTRKPHIKLAQLAKKVGPIYSIRLGSHRVVVLNEFELMKEAFANEAFIGRPPESPFDLSEDNLRTGAFNGPAWKDQRKFTLQTLRSLGLEKSRMEDHIRDEIHELLGRLEVEVGDHRNIDKYLSPSISNNISSFIFGRRMAFSDPKRKHLDDILKKISLLAGAVSWQIFFPYLGKLTKWLKIGAQGELAEVLQQANKFFLNEAEEHEASLNPSNVRDFMDGYLLEIKKMESNPKTSFTRDVMIDLSLAFFGAGSGTVRTAVNWVLLVAAGYPQVQRRIHAEVQEVVGQDNLLQWSDHKRMPYTTAVICEVMRWRTIIPLNFLRYTLEDTELNGYFIPKHTRILGNLHSVSHDERLWGQDKDQFRPERFLSPDGKTLVKPEYFIPFSIGKRTCPGKNLAELEIFLYVTSFIQKFEVTMPPGKEPDYDGVLGLTMEPKPQDLCLSLR